MLRVTDQEGRIDKDGTRSQTIIQASSLNISISFFLSLSYGVKSICMNSLKDYK